MKMQKKIIKKSKLTPNEKRFKGCFTLTESERNSINKRLEDLNKKNGSKKIHRKK